MNWTGGALGRSRNARTSLTAIQKRHFAKVRARLEPKHLSPRSKPTSDSLDRSLHRSNLAARCQNQQEDDRGCRSQRRLDDFEETKYIAKKLGSIRPRQRDSHSNRTPIEDDDGYCSQEPHLIFGSSPISISSRTTSPHRSSSDLEQSSPPSPRPVRVNSNNAPLLDPIEVQRRRLLEMSDWVGINPTKPPKIHFTNCEDRDQIGKRRRLSQVPQHGQCVSVKKRPRRTGYFERLLQPSRPPQDYLSQGDVSVRIGSAVDKSMKEDRSMQGLSTRQRSSMLADEMLLDDQVMGVGHNSPKLAYQLESIAKNEASPKHERSMLTPSPAVRSLPTRASAQDHMGYSSSSKSNRVLNPFHSSAIEPYVLQEDPAQDYYNEASQSTLTLDSTPLAVTECSEQRSSSPVTHHFTLDQNTDGKDALEVVKYEYETSPLDSIEPDNLIMLRAFNEPEDAIVAKERRKGVKSADSSAVRQRLERLQGASSGVYVEKNSEILLALHDERAAQSKLNQPVSEEETVWKAFVNMDDDEEEDRRRSATRQEPTVREPASVPPGHDVLSPNCKSLPQITKGPIQSQTPDEVSNTLPTHRAGRVETVEDEDAIWRSFVFQDDEMDNEWTLEEPKELDKQEETSSAIYPSRTQQSMVAEVATSPIKLNPHLVKEAINTGTSPLADKVSMMAEADTESTQQEEMLDSLFAELSSEPTSSTATSRLGQAGNAQNEPPPIGHSPSSLKPQVSTTWSTPQTHSLTNMVGTETSMQALQFSETNPLASSRSRIFSAQRQTLQQHQQNGHQASVIFKKPARYVGERALDPIAPVILGRKRSSRQVGGILNVENGGEDTKGLGYGDEIEDD